MELAALDISLTLDKRIQLLQEQAEQQDTDYKFLLE